MKNSFKYVLLIIITFMIGYKIVDADVYTCKYGNFTCNITIPSGDYQYCNTSDKKYSIQNLTGADSEKVFGLVTKSFSVSNHLTDTGNCPNYLMYSEHKKDTGVYLVNDNNFTYYSYNDKAYLTMTIDELGEAMKTMGYGVFKNVALSSSATSLDQSCESELTRLNDALNGAHNQIKSSSCDSMAYSYCTQYYTAYKKAIDNAKAGYEKYKNTSCSDISAFNDRIKENEANYNIYINLPKQEPETTEETKNQTQSKKTSSQQQGTGTCPLGKDVTKDLYNILKIFRIVAPLLCIAFSIIDAIKTITKGDAQTELKKVAQRFAKRMIYTIILFFLPLLVDQVMQIADVWGVNGTCDLENPVDNGANTSNSGSGYEGSGGSSTDPESGEGENGSGNQTKKECEEYTYTYCPLKDDYGNACEVILDDEDDPEYGSRHCGKSGHIKTKCDDLYTQSKCESDEGKKLGCSWRKYNRCELTCGTKTMSQCSAGAADGAKCSWNNSTKTCTTK